MTQSALNPPAHSCLTPSGLPVGIPSHSGAGQGRPEPSTAWALAAAAKDGEAPDHTRTPLGHTVGHAPAGTQKGAGRSRRCRLLSKAAWAPAPACPPLQRGFGHKPTRGEWRAWQEALEATPVLTCVSPQELCRGRWFPVPRAGLLPTCSWWALLQSALAVTSMGTSPQTQEAEWSDGRHAPGDHNTFSPSAAATVVWDCNTNSSPGLSCRPYQTPQDPAGEVFARRPQALPAGVLTRCRLQNAQRAGA